MVDGQLATSNIQISRWIVITQDSLPTATVTTTSGSLNIRSYPSLEASVSFTAAKNAVVHVLDHTSVSGWYWISCPDGTGWAVSSFPTLQEKAPAPALSERYGKVVASPDVNIRNGIGSGGLTIGKWPYNRIGIIRDVDASAIRYQTTYNGQTAYVSKDANHISNDLGDAPASSLSGCSTSSLMNWARPTQNTTTLFKGQSGASCFAGGCYCTQECRSTPSPMNQIRWKLSPGIVKTPTFGSKIRNIKHGAETIIQGFKNEPYPSLLTKKSLTFQG